MAARNFNARLMDISAIYYPKVDWPRAIVNKAALCREVRKCYQSQAEVFAVLHQPDDTCWAFSTIVFRVPDRVAGVYPRDLSRDLTRLAPIGILSESRT